MQNLLFQEYLWNLVLAVIASTAGIAAIGISFFRWKRRDTALMTFGTTSLLYGVRLLIDNQLGQYVTTAPPQSLLYAVAFCTYIIPTPLSGFILHLFGKGWKNSMLWALRGAIVFAITAILSDLIQSTPFSLMSVNNTLVIIWAVIVFLNTFRVGQRSTRELRIVLFGFIVFGMFAVNENLVRLNILPWEWTWEEIGFLVFLSSLGYIAVTRFFGNEARLLTIERELEIARQIQSAILPRTLPAIHGLQMTARYIPMVSVAGDFYDVLVHDGKRLCILVADVSGHGVGAALIASMLKVAFASQQQSLDNPAHVLAGINHTLNGKLESNFVTAGCLFIDNDAGEIRYAGAGHPPLILHRRSEHKLYELGTNGLPLGPFPDANYEITTMPIVSGDRFILYTDGIIETTSESGSFFGDGSFKAFIESHAHLAAEDFANTLLQNLTQWSGKPSGDSLDDDLTLIVVDKL